MNDFELIEINVNDFSGNGLSGNGLSGNGLSGNGISGNGCEFGAVLSDSEFDEILNEIK